MGFQTRECSRSDFNLSCRLAVLKFVQATMVAIKSAGRVGARSNNKML